MRNSLCSKIRQPPPEVSTYSFYQCKSTFQLAPMAAGLKTLTLEYQTKVISFFILLLLFPEPFYSSVSEQSCLNISTSQSLINSLWCYAKLKRFSVTITASLQSPPTASRTAIIIFVIGSSFCLPCSLLFLCWEGDRRHLLAHLFTLQTRPKLVAFPAVFPKAGN